VIHIVSVISVSWLWSYHQTTELWWWWWWWWWW